jgi:hypothetical protein
MSMGPNRLRILRGMSVMRAYFDDMAWLKERHSLEGSALVVKEVFPEEPVDEYDSGLSRAGPKNEGDSDGDCSTDAREKEGGGEGGGDDRCTRWEQTPCIVRHLAT